MSGIVCRAVHLTSHHFYLMKIRVILCPQSSFLLMPRCSGRLRSSIHLKKEIAHRQAVKSNIMILGFGFSGSGQNSAMAFTTLKDWRQRKGTTAQEEADHIRSQMANVPDAVTISLLPPGISDMGTSSGLTYYLQDRGGKAIRHSKRRPMSLLYRQIIILTLPMSILMELVREQAFPCMSTGKKRKPWGFRLMK